MNDTANSVRQHKTPTKILKTLFLFTMSPNEGSPASIFFFELEGDYRHLEGTYVNATDTGGEREVLEIVYGWVGDGDEKPPEPFADKDGISLKLKRLAEPTKDWDYFVKIGFFL